MTGNMAMKSTGPTTVLMSVSEYGVAQYTTPRTTVDTATLTPTQVHVFGDDQP